MYEDPYAAEEDHHLWRNVGLFGAIGIAGYVTYRYLTARRPDLAAEVRCGLRSVKDRVDQWTAEASQRGLDPGYGEGFGQDAPDVHGGRDAAGRGPLPPPQRDALVSPVM